MPVDEKWLQGSQTRTLHKHVHACNKVCCSLQEPMADKLCMVNADYGGNDTRPTRSISVWAGD
jgi:hypothetical protein